MDAVIWFLAIALPVAALLFLFGWLVGFNYSSDMSNWGTGFDDGWKAHKELTVHGKWVLMGGMKPPEWHHHHQCSVCESYAPMRPPYGCREALPPWCPGCGAKMDGEE